MGHTHQTQPESCTGPAILAVRFALSTPRDEEGCAQLRWGTANPSDETTRLPQRTSHCREGGRKRPLQRPARDLDNLRGADPRSMKTECARQIRVPFGLDAMRRELACYVTWYNDHRPHQSLDGLARTSSTGVRISRSAPSESRWTTTGSQSDRWSPWDSYREGFRLSISGDASLRCQVSPQVCWSPF